ncbi:MAG: 2-oxoacid:acceptor oxidoreductase subunit alpha [Gemmatimonadetes bacterium]|nr:2-oxoacid:acceptor oxidoreductase subunit alpha [Gemmatimonadota bacterium]
MSDPVNDFALKIATVNGTGSASANGLLMQSIFRMGVPVSGKNLFPSNIQGLPTWYEIRVSGAGHTSRAEAPDLMVVLNPATQTRDVAEVRAGGWVLHDSSWQLRRDAQRDDVTYLGIPFAELCTERFEGSRARVLLRNIAYLGALAALLDVEVPVLEELITQTYGRKKKLLDSNFEALRLGYDRARDAFHCPLPIRLRRMSANDDAVLIDGNTAAALGCVYAGATVAAWYPITPSTSLVDAFSAFAGQFRKDPDTGRLRVAILQAEDELAAAGMVIGAGWNGARSFTATSGPGISLMGEFIGLAYYAEIPSVFFDIQRTGPSTGMPTRTQQGDLLAVAYASHGDTRHIALFPADPHECFHFAVAAFDLAERYQTPVFVVSDLDIGMNDWVVPRLRWDDAYRPDRGKVLSAAELEAGARFARYLDIDGDGIPHRTLPGVHPRGGYFTRGSGHDSHARYTEDSVAYREVVDRIARKIDGAATAVPEPELVVDDALGAERPATVGVVTIGGCRGAVVEARERLRDHGVVADVLRIRGFPFHPSVRSFLDRYERVFVVEQNRDAQLRTLLVVECGVDPARLEPLLFYGGMPLSWGPVVKGILAALGMADPDAASQPTGAAPAPSPGSTPRLEIARGGA